MSTFGNFTVTRASTKNVLGSNGLLQSVANNVPAFEFNANGSYKGLLVEPGATNLATYSQAFGDASWSKANVTVSSDTTVAPDGTTTADSVLSNTVGLDEHRARKVSTMAINTAHTASIYVKKAGGVYAYIRDLTNNEFSIFDLDLVSVISTGVGQVSTIEPIGDYYRITTSFTTPGVITTNAVDFGFTTSSTLVGSVVPVGEGLIMWQAQLETGSVATSPIVTTGSTANRVADSVTLTGASSLIGQTGGGTLFVEVEWRSSGGVGQTLLSVSDGTLDNRIQIVETAGNEFRMFLTANGVNQTFQGQNASAYTGIVKGALGYSQDDTVLAKGGSIVSTDISVDLTSMGLLTNVYIGSLNGTIEIANMWIRAVALFPTRLSNAQLIALTS
jgi:hypothetical protein